MRTLFIFGVIILCAKKGIVQSVDSAYLKISYRLNYLTDSTKPTRKQIDVQVLFIGNSSSFTCSESLLQRDSVINGSKQIVEYSNRNNSNAIRPGALLKFRIFTSFNRNKSTIIDQAGLDKFYYEEKNERINWIIEPDTATILSYFSQKATCSYRGRNYVAWFTKEIPVSTGPYKFRGLPGLILRITDAKENYYFECIGLEKVYPKYPIILSTKGFIKTSRAEFFELQKNIFENPMQMFKESGISIRGKDGEIIKEAFKAQRPYNPIELK